MKLEELVKVIHSEQAAEEYLREKGVIKSYTECIYCGSQNIGKVRRNFNRCYKCKKEWSSRKGSILEKSKLSYIEFLLLLKLFILEVSANQASKELGISYRTVYKMYQMIRKQIYKYVTQEEEKLSGEIEMDEAYFGGQRKGKRGRGAREKIPVFGILERNGKVSVEVVEDVSAESLLRETIKKVKRGSLIYTDKFKSYDGMVMYGFKHERIDKSKRFANGRVYINGIEGFWSYAKQRLIKYHGVGREYFIYYIKELEFRYNERENLNNSIYKVLGGI